MNNKPLFDDEAQRWESLYEKDGPAERTPRWGLLQSYAQRRVQARLELCFSLLPPLAGKQVFELGCGPGFYGIRLLQAGAQWTGLDISSEMLNICRRNTGSDNLVRADVLHLPFCAHSCDVMLCIGVLSYLTREQIANLFSQVSAILCPGGLFLTQTIRLDPLTWVRCRLPGPVPRPLRIPGPLYPRNPRTIRRLLKEHRFSARRVLPYTKFGFYPAGTIYLAEKTG